MKVNESLSLDRTLESAIVASWADLAKDSSTGLIHVEYGFAPTGTLDYLKVWSSLTPGHWLLACEYWMSESTFHGAGIHFDNGYESEGLARILENLMQHQTAFALPANLGRQRLLQISTPTGEERITAAGQIHEALDRLGAALGEPVVA